MPSLAPLTPTTTLVSHRKGCRRRCRRRCVGVLGRCWTVLLLPVLHRMPALCIAAGWLAPPLHPATSTTEPVRFRNQHPRLHLRPPRFVSFAGNGGGRKDTGWDPSFSHRSTERPLFVVHKKTLGATTNDQQTSSFVAAAAPRRSSAVDHRIQHRAYHDNDAWRRGWFSVSDDCDSNNGYEITDSSTNATKTDFPRDLCGTFYQNGPGLFEIGDEPVIHPFDGDGLVRAMTFVNGTAWFRSRIVNTFQRQQERNANRILYRGVFGTAKNRGVWLSNAFDLSSKNVANTHVLFHNQRLYALWDAGRPIELDPITLQARGETWTYGRRYAAHYKVDPRRGTLCNFALYFGLPDPTQSHRLEVMEHNISDGTLLYRNSYILPGLAIGHDMAVTNTWMLFFRSPTKFDPLPFLLGRKGPAQCFQWDDDATSSQLYLVPRQQSPPNKRVLGQGIDDASPLQSSDPICVDLPPCFSFHVCNAFDATSNEEGRPLVVVDVVLADRMFMAQTDDDAPYPERSILDNIEWSDLPGYRLVRFEIDWMARRLVSQRTLSVLPQSPISSSHSADSGSVAAAASSSVDFPVIHPGRVGQEYRYAYLSASSDPISPGPLQGLLKVDVQRGVAVDKWLPEPHEFLSEVTVVPRSSKKEAAAFGGPDRVDPDNTDDDNDEDLAYLLGYVYDGQNRATDVVVFDARRVSDGPISRAQLRYPLPHPLHGTFAPGYVPPPHVDVSL